MKKILLSLTIVALFIGGCSKEDDAPSKYITVNAGIAEEKISTKGEVATTTFNDKDAISVYAWTGDNTVIPSKLVVNNSLNTYDGTSWTAAPQMLWLDMTTDHYFLGVYPSHEITDFTADEYILNSGDQTTSDVLIATNTEKGMNATAGKAVPLIFYHVMSKLIVNLSFRNEWGGGNPKVDGVTVPATTKGTVNYLNKTVTAVSDASDASVSVPVVEQNTQYSSVLIPQTISNITITITSEKKPYVFTNNDKGITLEGNKIQIVNLTVGKDEITLDSPIKIAGWGGYADELNGEAQNND